MDSVRGRFIVLEGADGVGTTTQTRALSTWLKGKGRQTHVTAEPSTGPIGRMIRGILKSRAHDERTRRELALLFAADRLDHYGSEIAPKLEAGIDVISDRYVLSSLVYQSLDLDLAWVQELNKHAPPPDATLLITLPLDEAARRFESRSRRDLFETRALQERIHAGYEKHAGLVGAHVIDGTGRIEDVTQRLTLVLSAQLPDQLSEQLRR